MYIEMLCIHIHSNVFEYIHLLCIAAVKKAGRTAAVAILIITVITENSECTIPVGLLPLTSTVHVGSQAK